MNEQKNYSEKKSKCRCQNTKSFFSRLWGRARHIKWWGWLLVVLALFVFIKGLGACYWNVRWHVAAWHNDEGQYDNEACRIKDSYGKYDMIPISDR